MLVYTGLFFVFARIDFALAWRDVATGNVGGSDNVK
jgi:hypothetical protein